LAGEVGYGYVETVSCQPQAYAPPDSLCGAGDDRGAGVFVGLSCGAHDGEMETQSEEAAVLKRMDDK
jgi:hypothetical protein